MCRASTQLLDLKTGAPSTLFICFMVRHCSTPRQHPMFRPSFSSGKERLTWPERSCLSFLRELALEPRRKLAACRLPLPQSALAVLPLDPFRPPCPARAPEKGTQAWSQNKHWSLAPGRPGVEGIHCVLSLVIAELQESYCSDVCILDPAFCLLLINATISS